jgi:F-type H+-transporting ATPase subunit a
MSLGITRVLTPIQPETVFSIGDFSIANSTLMILLLALVFFLFGRFVVRKFSVTKPRRVQIVTEMLYESIFGLLEQITGSFKKAKAIMPVVGSILVYFAVANVVGVIPGLTDITYNGVAIFRTPTSDFNTALGVSLAAVVVLNIISLRSYGFFGYLGNFFKIKAIVQGFKKSIMDGFIGLVEAFVGLLDIVGEIAKVISLSFRLFGNVYAGQVLAIIILGAISVALPAVWTIMSSFTGILQGMVFASLVAVYYTLSLKPKPETESE